MDDELTTAGPTATRWKLTEIKLKMKQSEEKKNEVEGRAKTEKKVR